MKVTLTIDPFNQKAKTFMKTLVKHDLHIKSLWIFYYLYRKKYLQFFLYIKILEEIHMEKIFEKLSLNLIFSDFFFTVKKRH